MENNIENFVIKVGTTTLTTKNENNEEVLDEASFCRIGQQITQLRELGHHAVIVSSGAISAGVHATGLSSRTEVSTVPDLQRLASIGWRHVLNSWDAALKGFDVGEVLLTRRELEQRGERNEAMTVMRNLYDNSGIAVVNENDAISHEEIVYGDNDTLAANLAVQIGRSALFSGKTNLVILSDVDGVYEDPDDSSSVLSRIDNIDVFARVAQDSASISGTGGMKTKFSAANLAIKNGVNTWIANGREDNAILRAIDGEIGTLVSADVITAVAM